MKKGYIWLAPLVVLVLFIGLYLRSRDEYEAKIAKEKKDKQEEILRRNEETKKRNDEIAEQRRIDNERKKAEDKAEQDRKDAEKKYLEQIDRDRDFAKRETARYENVVKDLTESFKTEKVANDAAKKAIEDMRAEKKFITEYVAKAQANEQALKELLQKLQKLEEDRLKAAAAAARG